MFQRETNNKRVHVKEYGRCMRFKTYMVIYKRFISLFTW